MTVTVAAAVEPSGGPGDPPRVRLDVTATGDHADTGAITVTRLDPDGRVTPVRTADGEPLTLTSGTGLLYDYEAPFGTPVTYSTREDPTTASAPVTVDEAAVWLIHPGVPVLSRPVRVMSIGARERPVQAGVYQPMGRATPVVQTDGARKSAAYTLTVRTHDQAERDAVDALLSDAGILLLNVPAGKGWGVGAEYVFVGDATETNPAGYGSWPQRDWALPCTVVDRPAGGTQAERTYADVLASFATYADVAEAYPSYFDLLAGP